MDNLRQLFDYNVIAANPALDPNILKEEQLQALANALGQLSQRERDLIILHYYKNVTLKEVAGMMGISYANVKIIHRKAIKKLNLLMQA